MTSTLVSRRQLLRGSGALVVTFGLAAAFRGGERRGLAQSSPAASAGVASPAAAQGAPPAIADDQVDSWLAIAPDGSVTVFSGKVELGTGIETALAQIVADELDVPFARVELIMGDTARTPNQNYTAGSKTIQTAGPILQQAAAEARQILLARASQRLGVRPDQLTVRDGVIGVTGDPAKRLPYGELVGEPFAQKLSDNAPVKSPSAYTVVGQPIARVDIPPKLFGQPSYVQDVRLDGMLHGRVVRPWVRLPSGVGATVESVDEGSIKDLPGLVKVVRNGSFVGVVAEREEQAIKAAGQLKVTWSAPQSLPIQSDLVQTIRSQPVVKDEQVDAAGDVEAAIAQAAHVLEATYTVPFEAHASIGPSCAVADVRADGATIYSSTQGVYPLRDALAQLLAMEPQQIHVIYAEGAGCYGHNGFDDAAADAALLSQAVGRPVRVQWMRQDEFAWEPKGPAMVVDVRGGLDGQGDVAAWDFAVWTPTHSTRPGGGAGNLLAGQLVDPPAPPAEAGYGGGDRNAAHSYVFPNSRVVAHWLDMGVLRPSALRSLGAFANVFANESFMDELAAAAGADPIAFRLRYLKDPRAVTVVKKVAEASGWQARPAGSGAGTPAAGSGVATGRGVAFAQYETEFTYVAVVAEVEVERASGNVRVSRVVVAHDCGLIINPNGLTNQIEGNVIQGTSRALKEEVTWDEHLLTSLDWKGYPILTFPEIPAVEVALIDRPDQPPLGAGEPTICPMAAAIGNAIYDATGARLRATPFTPERVKAALG